MGRIKLFHPQDSSSSAAQSSSTCLYFIVVIADPLANEVQSPHPSCCGVLFLVPLESTTPSSSRSQTANQPPPLFISTAYSHLATCDTKSRIGAAQDTRGLSRTHCYLSIIGRTRRFHSAECRCQSSHLDFIVDITGRPALLHSRLEAWLSNMIKRDDLILCKLHLSLFCNENVAHDWV